MDGWEKNSRDNVQPGRQPAIKLATGSCMCRVKRMPGSFGNLKSQICAARRVAYMVSGAHAGHVVGGKIRANMEDRGLANRPAAARCHGVRAQTFQAPLPLRPLRLVLSHTAALR